MNDSFQRNYLTNQRLMPIMLSLLVVAFLSENAYGNVQCPAEKSITLRSDSVTIIDFRNGYVTDNPLVNPSQFLGGDQICIHPATDGISPGLKIRNFYDVPNLSVTSPITFINAGGEVVFGDQNSDASVYIQNSRHLRVSGSGVDSIDYGFRIDGQDITSQGLKITNRSTDIEIDHWQIGNVTSSGIHLIGLANCADASPPQGVSYRHVYDLDGDGSSQRGWLLGYNSLGDPIYDPGDVDDVVSQSSFTMQNISIHHNYIHDTGTEGMYLGQNMVDHLYKSDGSRGPAMGSEVVCNYSNPNLPPEFQPDVNNTDDPLNARIIGIDVYSNRLVNTGWDGINVKGGARDCEIFDNQITNHGWRARLDGETDQTNGISTTPNVYCDVYRNKISGGGGSGIFLYGVGGIVANNLVTGSGEGGTSGGVKTTGIEIAAPDTVEWDLTQWYQGNSFGVYNNTVASALSYGYRFKVPYSVHKLVNNLAIATIAPPDVEKPGFNIASNVVSDNNLYFSLKDDKALNLDQQYIQQSGSVLIDAGIDVSTDIYNLEIYKQDLIGNQRIVDSKVDIGAFEWQGTQSQGGTTNPTVDENQNSNDRNSGGSGSSSALILLLGILIVTKRVWTRTKSRS